MCPPDQPATSASPLLQASAVLVTVAHRRRLRRLWRSQGWPSHDLIEVELIAAGLLERREDAAGLELVRVTDAGVALLASTLQSNRRARDEHEWLVAQVARHMQRAGRVVWRGLSLRAAIAPAQADQAETDAALPPQASQMPADPHQSLDGFGPPDTQQGLASGAAKSRWVMAMPDVYSIRNTTVEGYLEPIVHEIKVRRGDLLGDVRQGAKRAAYLAMASECWYVLKAGIGGPEDVPESCGVLIAHPRPPAALPDASDDLLAGAAAFDFEVARAAPKRAMSLSFGVWMALAKASCVPPAEEGSGQMRF